MKKIVLGFFLTILFVNSKGQVSYLPFPVSNAGWEVDFWIGPGYPHQYSYYYMDRQNNDTLINSVKYGRLYLSWTGLISDTNYVGAVRENNSGQVFYFPKDSLNEFLLYDYSLNVNDTFYNFYVDGPPFGPGLWSGRVTFKDSVLIANRYQRHLEVDDLTFNGNPWGGRCFWHEGVGSDAGLLESIRLASVSGATTLSCMNHNDTIWYSPPIPAGTPGNCAFFFQQVSEMPQKLFSIYPNPSNGTFTVSGLQFTDGTTINVFNTLGEMVYSQTLNRKQETVNCKLNAGIYFVEVRDVEDPQGWKEKQYVQKLIIE